LTGDQLVKQVMLAKTYAHHVAAPDGEYVELGSDAEFNRSIPEAVEDVYDVVLPVYRMPAALPILLAAVFGVVEPLDTASSRREWLWRKSLFRKKSVHGIPRSQAGLGQSRRSNLVSQIVRPCGDIVFYGVRVVKYRNLGQGPKTR
jgi:hypothetical protein